jgi:hypothetical protein
MQAANGVGMFKIDTVGNVNGAFVEENTVTGQQPTIVSAEWLNAVQSEILAVVTAGGLTPTKSNSSQMSSAISALISTAVSNLVNSSPAALDTLKELATALGNDANFSTTVTNALAAKAPLTGAGTSGTWNISVLGSAGSAPASDVYSWAKQTTKPSYSWSEISSKPTNVSAFANDAGYLSSVSWSSVSGKPTNVSAFTNDNGYISGLSWSGLTGKPTTIAGYGITDAIGVGQSWQSVTRTIGVTYTNTTGKPIVVSAYLGITFITNAYAYIYTGGVTVNLCSFITGGNSAWATISAIIPAGTTYSVSTNAGVTVTSAFIYELR